MRNEILRRKNSAEKARRVLNVNVYKHKLKKYFITVNSKAKKRTAFLKKGKDTVCGLPI
jgi:hypothetical protein